MVWCLKLFAKTAVSKGQHDYCSTVTTTFYSYFTTHNALNDNGEIFLT